MGEGPIPWVAIDQYCASASIVGEQREDVFYHVTHLDKAYLEWVRKDAERKTKK